MSEGYGFGVNYMQEEHAAFAAENSRVLRKINVLEDVANSEMKNLIERIRWRQEQSGVTGEQRMRLWSLIREGYCEHCGDRLPCQCCNDAQFNHTLNEYGNCESCAADRREEYQLPNDVRTRQ